jgi:hypothetical protein
MDSPDLSTLDLSWGALGGSHKRLHGRYGSCEVQKKARKIRRGSGHEGLTDEKLLERLAESELRSEMLSRQLSQQIMETHQSDKEKTRALTLAGEQGQIRTAAEQAASAARKAAEAAERRCRAAVAKADTLRKSNDALRKMVSRVKMARDQRVSVSADGNRRPLLQVSVASKSQGGKRMALDEIHTGTHGSLKVRFGGGLEYRWEELMFLFKAEVYAGLASRKQLGYRDEANMVVRARGEGAAVYVVPHARPGTKKRISVPQGPVQAFCRPSNGTMKFCRAVFRMLLHNAARQMLDSASTIVLMTDGKSFKSRHACGVMICIYSMEQGEEKDAFGNSPETRRVVRVPLQLQMQANKVADNLQTPFHVVRAFELAGLGEVIYKYRHILGLTTDAAVDNRGTGSFKSTMDNMTGTNSLLDSIFVSERASTMVDEDLKQLRVQDVLFQCHEGDEAQLRLLTANLRALRKSERDLREALITRNKVQAALSTPAGGLSPQADPMHPAPTPTAMQIGGNQLSGSMIIEGVSGLCPSPGEITSDGPVGSVEGTAGIPNSSQAAQTSGKFVDDLVASAENAVKRANAKLDADAAAFAALKRPHLSCRGTGVRSNPADRIQLVCTGPLFQVQETVKRIHILYENNRLTSVLDSPKVLRFWMQLWYCNAQDAGRVPLEVRDTKVLWFWLQLWYCNAQDARQGRLDAKRRLIMAKRKALRAFQAALRIRKIRFLRFHTRGKVLAGPSWRKKISQILSGDDDDGICAILEKLLHRLRSDPNVKVVSMLQSASRFFPLFDQRPDPDREICYNGQGQQCMNHAAHNITQPCTNYLDHEFLNRVIQAVKCAKSIYNEDELMAAINFLFSELLEYRRIDERTDFYRLVREGIAAQALAGNGLSLDEAKKEIGFTDEKGAETADTCAIVRWSTTTKAADWLASHRLDYAAGFLIIGAVALHRQTEVDAVVAVFSRLGFRSQDFPELMVENKVVESFELLTGSRTLFQLYLLAFLHRFIFKPLMALMSANMECGDLMVGMAGIPRRMLAVLRRGIFVGGKWSRRLAYGHRTNGAEYKLSNWSVCLLNPNCRGKVSHMLGDDWDGPELSAIRKGMVEAIPLLVTRMRLLACKQDPIMPQDAERIFLESKVESIAALFADPARETSFSLRMVQMQFLAKEVLFDTATSLEYAVRNGLQGVRAFVAGMRRTLWTDGKVWCSEESQLNQTQEFQPRHCMRRINYAHPMALADAVITLKQCEEIIHELKEKMSEAGKKNPAFRGQLERGKDPLDFLPAFVADAFGPEGQEAIRQFLGISKTHGEWGAHYNIVDSLQLVNRNGVALPRIDPAVISTVKRPQWREGQLQLCRRRVVRLQKELPDLGPFEWIQALYRGFYPWWLRRNTCIYRNYWNQVVELPKPLQAFPAAYGPSTKASNMAPTSKGMEQYWAYPALMHDTRSGLSNETLSNHFLVPAFRDPAMDPEHLAKTAPLHLISAAQEMAQFKRLWATFNVDKVKRSVMKADAKRKLAEKALNSKSGGWTATNHGGEYRRPRHAHIDPEHATGKTRLKILGKKCEKFLARRDAWKSGSLGMTVNMRTSPSGAAAGAQSKLQEMVARVLSVKKPAHCIKSTRVRAQRGNVRKAGTSMANVGMAGTSMANVGIGDESGSDADYIPGASTESCADASVSNPPRRSTRINLLGRDRSTQIGGGRPAVGGGASDGTGEGDGGGGSVVGSHAGPADGGGASGGTGEGDGGGGSVVGSHAGGAAGRGSDSDSDLDKPIGVRRPNCQRGSESTSDSDSDLDKPIGARKKDVMRCSPPENPQSGKIRGARKRSRRPADDAATVVVDSDDEPLFDKKLTKKSLNKDQQKLKLDHEVWSYDFAAACGHLVWYEGNRGNAALNHTWLMKERDTAIFHSNDGKSLDVTITRRPSPLLKRLLGMKRANGSFPAEVSDRDVEIKFEVHANSGRNYYLMYHEYAGVLMVKLESIKKPDENPNLSDDDRWGQTMSFRRVFDTKDAVIKAKHQQDNGIYMGELAMREILRKEMMEKLEPTVHEGDCTYPGDIRTLVGVVRWKKEGMNDLPKNYFSEFRTDLVLTGSSVSQNLHK